MSTKLIVSDLVGGLCVAASDGQIVHDKIALLLKAKTPVTVSFENVHTLISAFLNAAIGQLYGEFSEEEIRNHLQVTNMDPEDIDLLKRVIENAKVYFQNRKGFDKAWREEVDGE
jgi:hypothetical protein